MQKAFLAIAKGAKSVDTQWNILNLKKNLFQCKHVFTLMSSKGYSIKTMWTLHQIGMQCADLKSQFPQGWYIKTNIEDSQRVSIGHKKAVGTYI